MADAAEGPPPLMPASSATPPAPPAAHMMRPDVHKLGIIASVAANDEYMPLGQGEWEPLAPALKAMQAQDVFAPRAYPSSFLRYIARLREENRAMVGVVEGQDVCTWEEPDRRGGFYHRHWGVDERLDDSPHGARVSTCHAALQDPRNGRNTVDAEALLAHVKATPNVAVLELHCTSQPEMSHETMSPAAVAAVVQACPHLTCLILTAVRVDDAVLAAVPAGMRLLRLVQVKGASDAALAACIKKNAKSIVSVELNSATRDYPDLIGPLTAAALAACANLAVLRIGEGADAEKVAAAAATAAATPWPKLQSLHVETSNQTAPMLTPGLCQLIAVSPALTDISVLALPPKTKELKASAWAAAAPKLRLVELTPSRLELHEADGDAWKLKDLERVQELHLMAEPSTAGGEDLNLEQVARAAGLKALGKKIKAVRVVSGNLSPAGLDALGAAMPGLQRLAVPMALNDGDMMAYYESSDPAPSHDAALLKLAQHCPQLVALDVSSHFDAAYAVFSGRTLARMASQLPELSIVYAFENGRKFDYHSLRMGVRSEAEFKHSFDGLED